MNDSTFPTIAFVVFFTWAVGTLAHQNGRDKQHGYAMGFLFGPIAMFVYLIIGSPKKKLVESSED